MSHGSRVLMVLFFLFLCSGLGAADWRWYADFTEASSDEMAGYHVRLHSSGAFSEVHGVQVKDATFELADHIPGGVLPSEFHGVPESIREQWRRTTDDGLMLLQPGPLSTAQATSKEKP